MWCNKCDTGVDRESCVVISRPDNSCLAPLGDRVLLEPCTMLALWLDLVWFLHNAVLDFSFHKALLTPADKASGVASTELIYFRRKTGSCFDFLITMECLEEAVNKRLRGESKFGRCSKTLRSSWRGHHPKSGFDKCPTECVHLETKPGYELDRFISSYLPQNAEIKNWDQNVCYSGRL